jgi:predicted GNAT family N-acyltransferase
MSPADKIPGDYRVEPASWQADEDELRAVRERVFIIEQAIPRADEWDDEDSSARHVLARDAHDQAIGTGRLTQDAMIGRIAVLPEWRGRGVGKSIMRVLLEQARLRHLPAVSLHAQSHAIPLYESFGFRSEGEEFLECGIPHRTMRLELDPLAPRLERLLPPKPEARPLAVVDRLEARAALVDLLTDTRNDFALFTRDLDPGVLDAAEVLEQIKRIALSGRHARVRILLQDPRKAVADGNRLVALARRLPSAIEIRTPIEEQDQQLAAAFLVTDRHGYLYRTLASRHEGEGSTHAPGRHGQLLSLFDQMWERSVPSEELRQLGNS